MTLLADLEHSNQLAQLMQGELLAKIRRLTVENARLRRLVATLREERALSGVDLPMFLRPQAPGLPK